MWGWRNDGVYGWKNRSVSMCTSIGTYEPSIIGTCGYIVENRDVTDSYRQAQAALSGSAVRQLCVRF